MKQNGFTLIELLVTVAIIAGLGTVLAQSFFTTTRSATKVEKLSDVRQSGGYAIAVMERMIRNARSVAATCTTDGSQATSSVAVVNPDGGTSTFGCAFDGAVTRIASSSGQGTSYLTGASVTLGGSSCNDDSLLFYCTSLAQNPKSIKVSFQLWQKGTPADQFEKASTTFQTSISVRN